jgi:hypothetical protein
MSDKVQFQTNVPVDVALKYNDGKEVTGQYGDQVLYTLTDGRIMDMPPIVKREIGELGIGREELFTSPFPRSDWPQRAAFRAPLPAILTFRGSPSHCLLYGLDRSYSICRIAPCRGR